MDKQEAKSNLSKLIEKYLRLVSEGRHKAYNEAQTVNEFILPMFQFLGWDIHNVHSDEVTPEERISKGRVDWAFRIDSIPKFFLEAKALKVDLDIGRWSEQAINYSWNKGVAWAVLTDFEAIKVFNADISHPPLIPPYKGGIKGGCLFFEIPVSEYLSRFDQLWLLSKEAFKQGLLDKEAEKWGKKAKLTPVNEKLFEDMMQWRLLLSKGFHKANNLNPDELDEGVQRILDRLIFIRTAEDRGIEPNSLLPLLRQYDDRKPLIKRLSRIFRDFDNGYNSKLFEPHYSETWDISDETVKTALNGLYDSEGYRYDFSAISADVLGGIYEQYLGHILRQAKKRASVKKEHSKRKEQGIYYTPQFIVDYIVKNTIGKCLEDRTYKEIMDIKVLDPACGSGSFLIKAYDELAGYFERKDQQANLFTKFRILTGNIYGVDLDAQAVEIAQLNLLLKTLQSRTKLPNLAGKLRVGNSLISDVDEGLQKYFGNDGLLLLPTITTFEDKLQQESRKEQLASRMQGNDRINDKKPFAYKQQFPEVFSRKNPGFDVIIGNPPYVRIQTLPKDEVRYFSNHYKSAMSNYDIYALFVEQGFQLLREGGMLGFILPKKFFTASYGEGLREMLSNCNAVYEIVDFGHEQVFIGATTYTCLLFLRKGGNADFKYGTVKNLAAAKASNNLDRHDIDWIETNSKTLSNKPWLLAGDREASLIEKLVSLPKLEAIASNIFVGLQTSADSVYIMDYVRESDKNLCLYSKALGQEVILEPALLKPVISGADVKRYNYPAKRQYILFPYRVSDGKASLIDESELNRLTPKTYEYLKSNERPLKNRENGRMKGSDWYGYIYKKNMARQEQVKICVPRLVSRIQAIFDENGEFYLDNVDVGGMTLKDDARANYLYVLSLLNSGLLSWYLTKISTPFRGGFYSCNKQYLTQLPIKLLDISNPEDKARHDELSALAEKMLKLNKELKKVSENTDKWYELKREIEKRDWLINQKVYAIYGLTEEETEIVEGAKHD